MSTQQQTAVPVGTWHADPIHSSFGFSVRHMVVATFRGSLTDFDATLTGDPDGSAGLRAAGRVASVVTQDETLTAHLQSPDFFDAERFPEVTYTASDVTRDGDAIVVRGELTLKGVTRPVTLTGVIAGPVAAPGDAELIAVDLEAVIDRRDHGLDWNAPLPTGGLVVGHDVTLTAHLEMRRA
jgi:polyisoprenoid-binding protein YceI